MLAGHLRGELRRPGMTVLDLCTGSGFLALEAAASGAAEVTAVDVSCRAVLAARLNARLNGLELRAVRGDLFEPVRGRRFDVIVSNPPYLPSPRASLPRSGIARASEAGGLGRAFLDRICSAARDHLNDGGVLLLVHSSVCGERPTLEALARSGMSPQVVARQRGPLGPLLGGRADWLRRQGLLLDGDREEMLVIRAERCAVRHASGRGADRIPRPRVAAG